jgi:phosphate transport system substrate-binding protein
MSLAVDFSGLGDISLETVISAVALIGTMVVWLVDRYFLRRKRLVYRVQVDAPIGVFPSSHMVDVEVRYQGAVVPDPSIVLLRVDNAGGMDIEPHDVHEKVSFAFPDRKIVGLEVTEAKPEALGEMLERQLDSEKFIETSKLILPRTAINRGDSFKFLLVLSGRGDGVTHSGYLAGGSAGGGVYHEPRPRGPGRRTLMFGALSLVLVGALVALFAVDLLQPPHNCASGQLRIIGSTAVEPTMKELRSAYSAECKSADIVIAANGSRSGTRMLNDTGASDHAAAEKMIAMSDGPAEGEPDLQGQAVAVVVFAVVVNRSAEVTALTTTQLRDIYAGRLTNWKQLGGRDLPIRRTPPPLRGRYDGGTADAGERHRGSHRLCGTRRIPEILGADGREPRRGHRGYRQGRGSVVQVLGGRARLHLQGPQIGVVAGGVPQVPEYGEGPADSDARRAGPVHRPADLLLRIAVLLVGIVRHYCYLP